MNSEYGVTNILLSNPNCNTESYLNQHDSNVILTTLITADDVNKNSCNDNIGQLMYVNIPIQIVTSDTPLQTPQCSLQLSSFVPDPPPLSMQNDYSNSVSGDILSVFTEPGQVIVVPDNSTLSNQECIINESGQKNSDIFDTRVNNCEKKIIENSENQGCEVTVKDNVDQQSNLSREYEVTSSYLCIDTSGLETLYICMLCNEKFRTLKRFKVHFADHMNNKNFKCDQCSASFNKKINFILHSSTHITEGNFQCPSCQKSFRRLASFRSHIKIHEEEDVLVCNICDEEFTNMICLNFHLNEEHADAESKVRYVCSSCTESFDTYSNYKLHMNGHVQMKKLSEHYQRKSKGYRKSNFICHICEKGFEKRNQLIRHYRIHTGEKPYKCQVCDRAFNQKSSLATHMLQHDGKRPHQCKLCSCTFVQKGNLIAHVMRAHNLHESNEITYKCMKCSCDFATSRTLKTHMNRVHNHKKPDTNSEVSINSQSENIDSTSTVFNVPSTGLDFSILETDSIPYQERNDDIPNYIETDQEKENTDDIENLLSNITSLPVETFDNCLFPSTNGATSNNVVQPTGTINNFESSTSYVQQAQTTENCDSSGEDQCSDHPQTLYQCVVCNNIFNDEDELSDHRLENPSCNINIKISEADYNLIYRCKCNLSFISSKTFSMHVSIHNGQKSLFCIFCNMGFKTKKAFEEHFMKHASKNEFPCKYCGEMCDSETPLKHHVLDVHLRTINEGRADRSSCLVLTEEQRKYLTSVNLDNTASLSEHVLRDILKKKKTNKETNNDAIVISDIHENEINDNDLKQEANPRSRCYRRRAVDKTVCEYCSKQFRKMSDLERHIRTHTKEKPYQCEYCRKTFSLSSTLNDHIKTHTSLKEASCHVCSRFFANKSALTTHMRLHTGDMPYQCMYCDKEFRTSHHRNSHELNHFKNGVFQLGNSRFSRNVQFPKKSSSLNNPANVLNKPILRKRNGKLTFVCPLCNKIFDKRDPALIHVEAHRPAVLKIYQCDLCPAQFASKKTYVNHTKLYSSSCNLCKMHFPSEHHLTVHVDTVHNVIKPVIDEIINSAHDINFDDNLYIGTDKQLLDLDSVIDDIFVP